MEDNLGIFDEEGKNINPLTGEPYKNIYYEREKKTYKDYMEIVKTRTTIYGKRFELVDLIRKHQILLLESGTGSGKTLAFPQIVLHAVGYNKRVAITNPKKKPASDAAVSKSKFMDVELGTYVGYRFKNNSKFYNKTNPGIWFVTDGWVLQKIITDSPLLEEFDALILDEVHERGIQVDLLLFEVKEILKKRPNFKLILMSATIDVDKYRDYYVGDGFDFVYAHGGGTQPNGKVIEYFSKNEIIPTRKGIPVVSKETSAIIAREAYNAFKELKKSYQGAKTLIFIRGIADGNTTKEVFDTYAQKDFREEKIRPLEVIMSSTDEKTTELFTKSDTCLEKGKYTHCLIAATKIFESSITIDNLVFCIDSGLDKNSFYYPDKRVTNLETRYITQDAYKQRKGRVGRTMDGFFYGLYTKKQLEEFPKFKTAPIQQENISRYLMRWMAKSLYAKKPFTYKDTNVASLSYVLNLLFEPPEEERIEFMLQELEEIGIVRVEGTKYFPTRLSELISFYGTDDIYAAKMLFMSYFFNCNIDIAYIVAIMFDLCENDLNKLFVNVKDKKIQKQIKTKFGSSNTLLSVLNLYLEYWCKDEFDRPGWCQDNNVNYTIMSEMEDIELDRYVIKFNTKYSKYPTKKKEDYRDIERAIYWGFEGKNAKRDKDIFYLKKKVVAKLGRDEHLYTGEASYVGYTTCDGNEGNFEIQNVFDIPDWWYEEYMEVKKVGFYEFYGI